MELKKQLYQQCLEKVKQSLADAQQAIDNAQAAAKDDTKSSAGDKYETGREMMQQETDRNMAQLNEANKLLIALNKINTESVNQIVAAGSVAKTNNGNFYMAVSAGVLTVNNERYFAISPVSPIGMKLIGTKAGSEFDLNGKRYQVKEVV